MPRIRVSNSTSSHASAKHPTLRSSGVPSPALSGVMKLRHTDFCFLTGPVIQSCDFLTDPFSGFFFLFWFCVTARSLERRTQKSLVEEILDSPR